MTGIYEEEINGFSYYIFEEPRDLEYLLVALPDVGLVGSIAGLHLIRELGMKDVVGIDSYTALPPVVVIHKGEAKHPIRLYTGKCIGVLVTDVPIIPAALPMFVQSLVQFAKMSKVKMILSITGLGTPKRIEVEKPRLYALAVGREAEIEAGRLNPAKIENGMLVGPYALLLKEALRRRVPNLVLMVESFIDLPDPEAAAVAVESISKITGVDVNVSRLLEEAEKLKLRLKDLMKETRNVMAKMGKTYEYRPPLIYT